MVQLEPAESGRGGITAQQIPDSLNYLAMCIEEHLRVFTDEEFDTMMKDAGQGNSLQDIALCVRRQCKIDGKIIDDCAILHRAYCNGSILSGPLGSIPAVNAGVCYGVFGI